MLASLKLGPDSHMVQISLSKRMVGFAGFEWQLLHEVEHGGQVQHLRPREFRLKKPPYSEAPPGPTYLLPVDMEMPPEGAFIEIQPGLRRWKKVEIERETGDVIIQGESYIVESWKHLELRLESLLRPKEFMARVVGNWDHAEDDLLDIAIPLNMLSCPPGPYGAGGIGGQSLHLGSGKKPVLDIRRTILGVLPEEYTQPNPRYEFEFPANSRQADRLAMRRAAARVEEPCYNFIDWIGPTGAGLPIQIGAIILDAHYRPRSSEPDFEVLDFLLTAHMRQPVVPDEAVNRMIAGVRRVQDFLEPDSAGLPLSVDRQAITRLAIAKCRLEGWNTLDGRAFREGEDIFIDLFKRLSDARKNLFPEAGQRSWDPLQARISYSDASYGPRDVEIKAALVRACEERGEEWVHWKDIHCQGFAPEQVLESLHRLVQLGQVIHTAWALYRPLVIR